MLERALFSRHLEEDESVTLVVHKHWLLGVKDLVVPSLSFLLSLTVLSVTATQAAFYVVSLWALVSLVWWARNFFDYYLDAWIVTNHGIIDLEWHGWFHRQASRILYSDVQGVSYEIKGIMGTILRYGDVSVEKISTGSAISLSHVPRPRKVEAMILKNMETYLHSKNMKDAKHVQEILAGIVAERVQLKGFGDDESEEEEEDGTEEKIDTAKKPNARAKKGGSFSSSRVGAAKR